MSSPARTLALPLIALALVAAVLVVQVAHGGGSFAPSALADPCTARSVEAQQPDTLDALGQQLVLRGLDHAACRLGTSREALTLGLAENHTAPTDAQVEALRAGLLDAVDEMQRDGTLPPASALVDEALDATDLNPVAKLAIRALPASVVDAALPTDQVLRQAVQNLDVRALLADLDDGDQLGALVGGAVQSAVEQTVTARLRGLLG